jgi:hypothetical protein
VVHFSITDSGAVLGCAHHVTLTFFAATISTSTDEHIAPVLGVFTILALVLIAAADVLAQATYRATRATLRRVGHQ